LWVSGVKVRLIGMDTPETRRPGTPVQCFGELSSRRMAALLPVGTAVRLVYDRGRLDRYGRTLAYVYRTSDGMFVNAELVREGYAKVLTVPPNTAHQREFEALQRAAQSAGRGRWSACPATS
jgi:micrococcal nuclease